MTSKLYSYRGIAFFLLFFMGTVCGASQVAAQDSALTKANLLVRSEQRLKAIAEIQKLVVNRPEFAKIGDQFRPFISDYSIRHPIGTVEQETIRNADYVSNLKGKTRKLEQFSAVEAIAKLARDRKIVILNEAHDMAQHRAFGHELALKLHQEGFTHLGIEALSHKWGKSGQVKIEYPTTMTGHYIGCPVFGDFVRQTAKAGYKLISYEIEPQQQVSKRGDLTDRIMERESAQCGNLVKHVFNKNPDARLFIYVGYAHATENWEVTEDGRRVGWLAAQLKKATGFDPLTIDQVGGSYNPNLAKIDPVFALINDNYSLQNPSVFKDATNDFVSSDSYYRKTDLTVFHPPQRQENGRPNWLSMNGYRKPFLMEKSQVFVDQPVLVQAFLESEQPYGLPVDQLLIENANGVSQLLLPKSRYVLKLQTVEKTTVWKKDVVVD